jgi:hypothetical protein
MATSAKFLPQAVAYLFVQRLGKIDPSIEDQRSGAKASAGFAVRLKRGRPAGGRAPYRQEVWLKPPCRWGFLPGTLLADKVYSVVVQELEQ